ncbi:MAG: hypothetical protein U0487_02085 [Patescibacteria group bacterium]
MAFVPGKQVLLDRYGDIPVFSEVDEGLGNERIHATNDQFNLVTIGVAHDLNQGTTSKGLHVTQYNK